MSLTWTFIKVQFTTMNNTIKQANKQPSQLSVANDLIYLLIQW